MVNFVKILYKYVLADICGFWKVIFQRLSGGENQFFLILGSNKCRCSKNIIAELPGRQSNKDFFGQE